MPYDLLKKNIENNVSITDAELLPICSHFKPAVVKKGDFILTQGSVCTFEGFVTEGCFKIFTLDKKGNENILYFAVKDWWLIDTDSFMNRTPSDLNMQALEDSTVLMVDRPSKKKLYNEFPIVEKLFRIMSQKAITAWQRRLIRNHSLTAKERYLHFVSTYPNITSKLTDRQIASYLGITHEFLSKIKRKTIAKE